MNQNEFKKEILDYIGETYDEFTECQAIVKDIFRVFHRIACSHGITYALTKGALLGIIRDGDLIPWDYDMDICVPYDQIHELTHILQRELPEGYFVISNFTDKKFPYYQTRIGNVNYDVEIIHLDIFYLCGAPADNQQTFKKEVRTAFSDRRWKMFTKYGRKETMESKTYFYWLKFSYGIKLLFTPVSRIDKKLDKYLSMVDLKSAQYYMVVENNACIFKKSDFEPCKTKIVGEDEYRIPQNPDAILNAMYSDYHAYLSIRSRFEEMYSSINRFRRSRGEMKKEFFRK